MAGEAAPQNSPFIRELATSDARTRTAALAKLRQYLSIHQTFTELELLKLWKGLFFCMWMTDRPKVQYKLSLSLAELVEEVAEQNVLPFLDAFWKTMAREWSGIDALRMDKFMTLIRHYLAASWRYLARQSWANAAAIDGYIAILEAVPLNPDDDRIPNGLRYHVLDIYVDELDRVDSEEVRARTSAAQFKSRSKKEAEKKGEIRSQMPLDKLIAPLRRMQAENRNKAVRNAAAEALADPRLADWSGRPGTPHCLSDMSMNVEDEQDDLERPGDGDGEEWGGIDDD